MKELTIREKAAITLFLSDDKVSTVDIFICGTSKSVEEVNQMKSLSSAASHWIARPLIQDYIRTMRLKLDDKRAMERSRLLDELQSEIHYAPPMPGGIDYSDPKNRQRLYNEVIARSKNDPKTQLDAAKMFEQIQKDDREAAKVLKQSRVYLPLRCESCTLYLKAKEELKTSK